MEALKPGSVVVDMSSIKPAEAKDHARRLAERGVAHIDAPVSGGTVGAEQGTLAIMAGGEAGIFAKVAPILRAMGRPVHVGPAGAGQFAKLANQIIVGVTIGAVAEALLLAQQGGADPAKVREALRGGFAESRILDLHGQRMIERDFATKGRTVTHLKDLDNALDAAHRLEIDAVLYTALTADLFHGLLDTAGDLDHSGLIVELERRNRITARSLAGDFLMSSKNTRRGQAWFGRQDKVEAACASRAARLCQALHRPRAQADRGADFDFLVGKSGAPVPRATRCRGFIR
jgi:3-hydroxyisobutyrate dehydrogenase-like beta-hydroxyacid dehydrogenase